MSQPPRKRRKTPNPLEAKTDRDFMEALFGKRIMKRVDKVVEPRRVEDSETMNAWLNSAFWLVK